MEKSNIDSRINRLIGQIEGIRRMIHGKRKCEEVAQQVLAAREALSKIGILVLKEGLCKTKSSKTDHTEQLLQKVFRM